MGIKVQAELQTNIGRIDLVIEMQNFIYIMELNFDKTSAAALNQIEVKNYKQRYATEEKDLVLMGINFSSKSRNISDCKAVVHHKDGSKGDEGRHPCPASLLKRFWAITTQSIGKEALLRRR